MLKVRSRTLKRLPVLDPGTAYILVSVLFCLSQGFFSSTYQLFLLQHLGSKALMNSVNMWFMASIVVLEVPTGLVSDIWGRKASSVLGFFCWAMSMLVYFVSKTYPAFVCAELFGAAGFAFISGAFVSWVTDWVGPEKVENVLSWENTFSRSLSIPSKIIGGYLGAVNLRLPWLVSGVCGMFVTALAFLLMRQDPPIEKTEDKVGLELLLDTTANSWGSIIRGPALGAVICLTLQTLGFQAINMFWPSLFVSRVGGTNRLGYIMAGIALSIAFGSWLNSRKIVNAFNSRARLIFSAFVIAGGIFAAAVFKSTWLMLTGFFIHEIGRGFFKPVFTAFANKYLQPESRATANSLISLIRTGGAFLGLGLSGLLTLRYRIETIWVMVSVLIAFSAFAVLVGNGEE